MKHVFIKLVGVYLLSVLLILMVLPINKQWGLVAFIMTVFSVCLQLFWNKYFKK